MTLPSSQPPPWGQGSGRGRPPPPFPKPHPSPPPPRSRAAAEGPRGGGTRIPPPPPRRARRQGWGKHDSWGDPRRRGRRGCGGVLPEDSGAGWECDLQGSARCSPVTAEGTLPGWGWGRGGPGPRGPCRVRRRVCAARDSAGWRRKAEEAGGGGGRAGRAPGTPSPRGKPGARAQEWGRGSGRAPAHAAEAPGGGEGRAEGRLPGAALPELAPPPGAPRGWRR